MKRPAEKPRFAAGRGVTRLKDGSATPSAKGERQEGRAEERGRREPGPGRNGDGAVARAVILAVVEDQPDRGGRAPRALAALQVARADMPEPEGRQRRDRDRLLRFSSRDPRGVDHGAGEQ